MLGAQDFCGYYDWTFHFVRSRYGDAALRDLWALAVGLDAQRHYLALGEHKGMRGLFDAWKHTGEDEQCDWTFTLDESRNVLRWDMRRCPSKGFLIAQDRQGDQDYCDHCIGWESAMLARLGMEMARHEHNHCGQCWGEIRVKGKSYRSPANGVDIRNDPRWMAGHLDRFAENQCVSPDPVKTILDWAHKHGPIRVDSEGESAPSTGGVLTSARRFLDMPRNDAVAVLIDHLPDEAHLRALAKRWASAGGTTLLLYPFLPGGLSIRFPNHGLPRPLPVLPLWIRAGVYRHEPHVTPPTMEQMLCLTMSAMTPLAGGA